jgi:hypothetical protein
VLTPKDSSVRLCTWSALEHSAGKEEGRRGVLMLNRQE